MSGARIELLDWMREKERQKDHCHQPALKNHLRYTEPSLKDTCWPEAGDLALQPPPASTGMPETSGRFFGDNFLSVFGSVLPLSYMWRRLHLYEKTGRRVCHGFFPTPHFLTDDVVSSTVLTDSTATGNISAGGFFDVDLQQSIKLS